MFDIEKVQEHALAVRESYTDLQTTDKINILNIGKPGTGKTRLAISAPKPVLIHSFDKGGTKTAALKPFIADGSIIADTIFEQDDWKNPRAFRIWETKFAYLLKIGFFEAIGTYILDSATTFADSMMYALLRTGGDKRGSRTGELPGLSDYHLQQYTMIDYLNVMMSLPCTVLVNGHITFIQDAVTEKIETGILLAGKASDKVPLVFDEKYISRFYAGGWKIQTKTDGLYHAETRVGELVFKQFEEPDLKKLLSKAGIKHDDKPSLSSLVKKEVTAQK